MVSNRNLGIMVLAGTVAMGSLIFTIQSLLRAIAAVNEPPPDQYSKVVAQSNLKSCGVNVNVLSVKYVNTDVNAFSVEGYLGDNPWLPKGTPPSGIVFELSGNQFVAMTGRYGWLRVVRYPSGTAIVSILANTLGPAPQPIRERVLKKIITIENSKLK